MRIQHALRTICRIPKNIVVGVQYIGSTFCNITFCAAADLNLTYMVIGFIWLATTPALLGLFIISSPFIALGCNKTIKTEEFLDED